MPEPPVLPTFEVEGRSFTRLILGHNPFLGGSYMSRARSREYEERFRTYEPIRDVILAALGLGIRSMMLSIDHPRNDIIGQAIGAAQEQTGLGMSNIVIIHPGFRNHLDFMRQVNCQVCLLHGQNTDSLFRRSERTFPPEFAELLAAVRAEGFVPGMSTHNGGETIPTTRDFDVAVVNTPVNKIAWRMCPCVEEVLGAIREWPRKVIAMKPLAMGRIAPQEGIEFALGVFGVDGVCVGIATPAEAEETFGIAAEVLQRQGRKN